MRQRVFVSAIIVVLSLVPSLSMGGGFGSVYGGLATAQSYGLGKGTLGISAGIADANSIGGWFGYGMSKYVDGRFKVALFDAGSETKLAFGGDFKWQFWSMKEGTRYPFDMAVGGFVEYDDRGPGSIFQIGSHLIGSYPFALNNRSTLSPYGRLSVRLERDAKDNLGSNSDIRFGLNGGAVWELTPAMRLFGELQLDGNNGLFLGLEFDVM